ncbi:M14 family zinc carboxypeptidase [Alkalihalobacillus sp. AL-G]|uniref:M14 family zinc carboxypeptidase n=1 Tax=Alkalihalobacillus sp. AL-G TaxID=2926399 RepID=UPI00272A00EA|nr:M14 family zinc carboxypeptidase [Alkalihalobacillus sp. AL-G]WLD92903.1 Tat (twin-arginine translocation) pathway signal sequence [Alkalihalobacillus sp. AL-G]
MKQIVRGIVLLAIMCMMFSSVAFAEGNTKPGGPSTNGNDTISSIMTYEEMVEQLYALEKRSKAEFEVTTLDDYGKSEQGNSIYVAKVGHGDTKVWVQAQIHGDEKLTTEAVMQLLKTLASSGGPDVQTLLDELTLYVIPMYNPDGSIMNTRGTLLMDENGEPVSDDAYIDLNRGWTLDGFKANESKVVYAYWADVKPDFAVDLHHQGFKTVYGTNEATSFSLGISLAPDGPTLPSLENGYYNKVTKQMQGYVYDSLTKYGYTRIDQYQVGGGKYYIDIRGGVVSAMMMGLNYNNLNPDGHSNPAIFFETKGNTREGSLGQKSNGYLTKQNYLALKALLTGIATEEVHEVDPDHWYDIPAYPAEGYFTDYAGILPIN